MKLTIWTDHSKDDGYWKDSRMVMNVVGPVPWLAIKSMKTERPMVRDP